MRFIAVGIAVAITAPAWAQQVFERRVEAASPNEKAMWVAGAPAIADAVFVHGPGIRFEGPPKAGAPYSAEAVTETVQVLPDGNRIVRENRAKVYRDNEGRTRREEKLGAVGPWAVAGDSPTRVFINDPVAGVHWVLEPENKLARKMVAPKIEEHVNVQSLHGETGLHTNVDVTVAVDAPAGVGVGQAGGLHVAQFSRVGPHEESNPPKVEDLGTRVIEGVESKGTKITRTIPAGEIGNERPIEVVLEQWRSEELGVDVLTKRSDPRSAETTYKLTNIQRTEPLPGLFEAPPDYEVSEPSDVLMRKIERKN